MKIATLVWVACLAAACGSSPSGPTATTPLPFVSESATLRIFYESGDAVEIERQEAFNAWALQRLGLAVSQKIEYRKYRSREDMGRYTGRSNTNGFAEPEQFRFHTLWPFDNHEIVHVYSALIGRPSDFFNEGLAVSFQADPFVQDFTVRFNGQQVHEASRAYLRAGTLPLPVSRYATSDGFRGIADDVMSYRMAGSFVLHMSERFGVPAVMEFFRRVNDRGESLATIRARMLAVFGVSLEDVEASWLATLRQ